jgi:hypothetical protein
VLRAIRHEADVFTPRVAKDRNDLEASLNTLVDTALEPLDVTRHDRAVARALVDLNTWEALRDQDLHPADRVTAISLLLTGSLTTPARMIG